MNLDFCVKLRHLVLTTCRVDVGLTPHFCFGFLSFERGLRDYLTCGPLPTVVLNFVNACETALDRELASRYPPKKLGRVE